MSGIGGIAPRERDLSRPRDRQAAAVLALTAGVGMVILLPLGLALGLIAMAYARVSGASRAFLAALLIVRRPARRDPRARHGLRQRPLPRLATPA